MKRSGRGLDIRTSDEKPLAFEAEDLERAGLFAHTAIVFGYAVDLGSGDVELAISAPCLRIGPFEALIFDNDTGLRPARSAPFVPLTCFLLMSLLTL